MRHCRLYIAELEVRRASAEHSRAYASGFLAMVLVALASSPVRSQGLPDANIHVQVSAGLINKLAEQDIARCDPVDEEVKDIPVRGQAFTLAKARIELAPDCNRAVFDIVTRGRIHSRVYADAYSVYAHAEALSPFANRKRVVLTARGIAAYAATSNVMTASRLLGFSSEFGDEVPTFIREMAVQIFEEDRHVDDTLASFRAMLEMNKRVDQESLPKLREADQQYRAGLVKAREYGVDVEQLHFSTSRTTFYAAVRLAADAADLSAPPAVADRDADVALRVHQAAVNRILQRNLAGKDTTERELKSKLNEALEKLGMKLKLAPAPVDVKLQFAVKEPLTLTFNDNTLGLNVHFAKIALPGGSFSGIKFRMIFKIAKQAEGIALVRQGRVELLSPSGNVLQDELIRVGVETMLVNRVEIGSFSVPLEKAGAMEISGAQTAHGWLAATLRSRD